MSRVLRELLDFADRLEAGALADPVAEAVLDRTDERFAVRVPAAAAVDLTVLEQGAVVTRLRARGDVVASDRRLLVVSGEQVLQEWSWQQDVAEVSLLQDGLGIGCLPSDALWAAGTRTVFGVVTERMLEHPLPSPADTVPFALRWFMVAGAWWAARGDLDGWREHLQGHPW